VTRSLPPPRLDPTPIFEAFRGNHATELLTAAVSHFRVFERLSAGPRSSAELRQELGLAERPAIVLLTALRALGLLVAEGGRIGLSELAREHLVPGQPHDVSSYVGLAADSPGVLALVERLRSNRPAGAEADPSSEGTAFIYREGVESAMEKEAAARRLTLALGGRARNVAPLLAARVPLEDARVLLDVGGGTGLYAIACLLRNPRLHAIIWDRPEVLKVAGELAAEHGVAERVECRPGDMFKDPVPSADVVMLSNVLHDWDVPECRALIRRCADVLPAGGRLLIHDVFLDDDLGGPLPIALYSAALFSLTEGRAYSAAEYRNWLTEAGLVPGEVVPTLIHCGVLPASRS
jgi:SAM-dependent methyltransferase